MKNRKTFNFLLRYNLLSLLKKAGKNLPVNCDRRRVFPTRNARKLNRVLASLKGVGTNVRSGKAL